MPPPHQPCDHAGATMSNLGLFGVTLVSNQLLNGETRDRSPGLVINRAGTAYLSLEQGPPPARQAIPSNRARAPSLRAGRRAAKQGQGSMMPGCRGPTFQRLAREIFALAAKLQTLLSRATLANPAILAPQLGFLPSAALALKPLCLRLRVAASARVIRCYSRDSATGLPDSTAVPEPLGRRRLYRASRRRRLPPMIRRFSASEMRA